MARDDFGEDEPTLPPLDPRAGPVCPRCHSRPSSRADVTQRNVRRCPKHGLAYVDARELVESGGDSLLGTAVSGRFTILARLGAGSMGAVYRARQEAVGRDVALKIVRAERAYDAETKTRFEREARATSSLVSPYTITVFDFGEAEDGSWFLAMELLEGETLGDRLRRQTRLGVVDAVRFARQAAVSLGEAHSKGIIHRDLKPDNLFLARVPVQSGEPEEIVKVLDFGIAKLVRGEDQRVDQLETQAGTVFGTPRYMSPEQAQGAELDARTDVYSLGVILYQMLCGRPPFIDDDAVVVMAAHIRELPPPLAEIAADAYVPPAVEAVVRRALQKLPNMRQQSAEQLATELEVALQQSSVHGTGLHATSWVGPPAGGRSSSRAALAVLAVGVALALAVAGFFFVKRIATPREPVEPVLAAASNGPGVPVPSTVEAPRASAAEAAPTPSVETAPDGGTARKLPRLPRQPALPAPPAPTKPEGYGKFD